MSTKNDELGDRMKSYEGQETSRRFLPMLPIYARIDGRGFSKLTKGMGRPFDARMSAAMIATTEYLVKETHALVGYVQSDEISLCWKQADYESGIFFDGKIMKMTSVLASMAAAAFGRAIRGWSPFEDRFPSFDARVLQLPLDYECANMFLWRNNDALKNAVSMACRAYYSPGQMHAKNQAEMIAMLAEKGVSFDDYPDFFKHGTWVRRQTETRLLTDEERERIPVKNRPAPDMQVVRSKVVPFPMPPFRTVANRTEVIFEAAEPVRKDIDWVAEFAPTDELPVAPGPLVLRG